MSFHWRLERNRRFILRLGTSCALRRIQYAPTCSLNGAQRVCFCSFSAFKWKRPLLVTWEIEAEVHRNACQPAKGVHFHSVVKTRIGMYLQNFFVHRNVLTDSKRSIRTGIKTAWPEWAHCRLHNARVFLLRAVFLITNLHKWPQFSGFLIQGES
jgi:hypothetical protein